MKEFIAFTYDEPNDEAAPLWTPGTPRDTPVSIWWKPTIGCTAEQYERQQALTEYPGIPWHDMNIAEVWVESRKTYEILNKIVPPGQRIFARILPAKWFLEMKKNGCPTKIRNVTIFTHGNKSEFNLASEIADEDTVITSSPDGGLLNETHVVVFCHRAESTLQHLCDAIGNGCAIVTSDAGAAEEYLCRFAEPGHWHVARTWNSEEWRNMILDLQGKPNKVTQISVVDQTPYIPVWRKPK